MYPIYQTLGLGLVILITGAALKVEGFAGHCIVVKGEFLWVKVDKMPGIALVGLVGEELVVPSLGGGGGYSGGGVAPDKVAGGGGSYKEDSTWKVIKGGCEDGDGYVSFFFED